MFILFIVIEITLYCRFQTYLSYHTLGRTLWRPLESWWREWLSIPWQFLMGNSLQMKWRYRSPYLSHASLLRFTFKNLQGYLIKHSKIICGWHNKHSTWQKIHLLAAKNKQTFSTDLCTQCSKLLHISIKLTFLNFAASHTHVTRNLQIWVQLYNLIVLLLWIAVCIIIA